MTLSKFDIGPKILIETQYIPSIAFYSFLYQVDELILDKHENYHKGSYRNRCEILSAQGRISLSVPLKSGKNNQLAIDQVEINNQENWQQNHLRSIRTCYGKSPYFEYYFHIFEAVLSQKFTYLYDLNYAFIDKFASIFDLGKKLSTSSKFHPNNEDASFIKRDFISPKSRFQGNIKESFNLHPYDQVFGDEIGFEANLSILDLIFCLGPEAILYLSRSIKK